MTDFKTRIKPFVDHYEAYKEHEKLENALQTFVRTLHSDNDAYIIETPFRLLVEKQLKESEPELFEWYCWFLFECNAGRRGPPGWDNEFSFTDPPSRTYRASEFTDNPAAFFRAIFPYLEVSE